MCVIEKEKEKAGRLAREGGQRETIRREGEREREWREGSGQRERGSR